ncbi:MAG: IclR family transcriptional regulator [Pigmentiphaga sp.]
MSGRRSAAIEFTESQQASRQAQTLVKGLSLLRVFSAGEQHLGNKDLAERTGLPRSTVSRLAGALVKLGYLRYSDHLGRYALGAGVLTLAYPMVASLTIRHIARPFMKQFAEEIKGQVSMGMAYGTSMVFIETSRSSGHCYTLPETGATISILISAMGRGYLARLSPGARDAALVYLREEEPVYWAAHGHKVEQAVRDYHQRGFVCSYGDARKELHACGVALRTRIDNEILVVNCSVPAHSLRGRQLEDVIGPKLVAVCRQIDGACGQP